MATNLRTNGEKSFAVFNYVFMTLLCIICLYPLWYVLVSSLSDPILLYMQRGIMVWPIGEWSMRGYQLVMENPNIPNGFRNTLIYLVVGTTANMFITTMAAYGLSRKDCYWNAKIMKLIAFTMYFGGGLIPFYLMVKGMNLIDKYSGIILPVLLNTWNLIVMRTAFAGIPDSLEESAKAGKTPAFELIFLPQPKRSRSLFLIQVFVVAML